MGHTILADSLARLLEDLPGFDVAGRADSLRNLLDRAGELRPDVVIFVGSEPDGLRDLGRLLDLRPGLTVVRADPRDDTLQFVTGQRVAANIADLLAEISYISLGS